MSNLVQYLFETEAIKICEENKPFWYTSGKISPNYINTHFLYGGETKANALLSTIDDEIAAIAENKDAALNTYKVLLDKVLDNYSSDHIYKEIIDSLVECITTNIGIDNFIYISGGERRDWFFSIIVAYLLKKPHITIFKDLTCVTSNSDGSSPEFTKDLEGKTVLHISDLITVAASYERAWIPAIEEHKRFI